MKSKPSKNRSVTSRSSVDSLEARRLFAYAFTLTDLTPDTRAGTRTGQAYGVSNNGYVALSVNGNAAVWKSGVLTDLGFKGYATDVNDSGTVVGADTSTGTAQPFIWTKSAGETKLVYNGDAHGVANAINNAGTVVGTFYGAAGDGTLSIGFVKSGNVAPISIGGPSNYRNVSITATGVNASGQILGEVSDTNGTISRSFVKTNGTFKLVATPPGGPSTRAHHGIADSGTVAVDGPSSDLYTDGTTKIYHVYTTFSNDGSGGLFDEGTLSNDYDISATDINIKGNLTATINGGATPFEAAAKLGGGSFVSGNTLIDPALGVSLFGFSAINDSDQIVGYGYNADGQMNAYLLTRTPMSSIHGTAFNDTNKNGVRDAGEPNSGAVTIFLDTNDNGIFDADEPTTATNANGEYAFTNLAAGTYHLGRLLANGFVQTTVDPGKKTKSDSVDFNENDYGIDLGAAPVAAATYQIRGKVFNDTNNNGVFDGGEVVSGARTVFIDANGNGTLDGGEKSVQSGSNGEFVFDGLANGVYKVTRVVPSGYHVSNPNGYVEVHVNGATVTGVNVGSSNAATPPAGATITGRVFNDTDKDGLFDSNESASGVRTVFIDTNGNKTLDAGEKSVQSNSEGRYTFTGLAAGTYKITRVFPSGYHLSNNNVGYLTITVSAGQTKTGADLGSASN